MGVLQRFERRLGGIVEGAFARVFKGEVQPVEIAGALRRETDDKRAIVGQGRVLVPNEFVVELGDHDYRRLVPWADPLGRELGEIVAEHAAELGYAFTGPLSITFEHATGLDTGLFRVRSSVAAPGPTQVPPPPPRSPATAPPAVPSEPEPRSRSARLLISGDRGRAVRGGGNGARQAFEVRRAVTLVGRGAEADLRLPDPGVSRRHAEIRSGNKGFVLVDLGSTNGTTVNDAPISRRRLADGDSIRLGSTTLVFRQDT